MRSASVITVVMTIVVISKTPAQTETTAEKARFEGQKPGERRELVTGMPFRWCPAGKFTMGSPPTEVGRNSFEAQQEEVIPSGYWLQETEVTQKQWKSLMETTPWKGETQVVEADENAAAYIDQVSATAFCRKLTMREQAAGRLPGGWRYVLPSEAQWEYACRAGTTTTYSFGDEASQLSNYAWWGGSTGTGSTKWDQYAHPVGEKKPNAWGFKDMHGNVQEWCSDESWPESRTASATQPGHRVLRGGSWAGSATLCRSASRYRLLSDASYSFIGFRVAAVRSDN